LRELKIPTLLLAMRLPQLISSRLAFALNLLQSSAPTDFMGEKNLPANSSFTAQNQPGRPRTLRSLLFTGCVMEGLFTRVNRATTRVLQANNCEVRTPSQQVCCGALHAHAGDLEGARTLARRNIEAFATEDEASIITNAGGCGAMLCSYGQLLADDPDYSERAQQFSLRVKDISQQLATTGMLTGAAVTDGKTTYDASCHLLYGQRATSEPVEMLGAINSLKYVPLEGSEVCCGGAGVYNLLEPDLSARVLNEKLHHIKETKATVLATGNPGCHMQIAAGAHAAGMEHLRVCHPVELLDEAYRRAGFYQAE
jgi:glycolate oxidase iron-sulfur subunit